MMPDPDATLRSAHATLAEAERLLTVAECAAQVSTSPDFITREIKAGALLAVRRKRPSGRSIVRIPESAWKDYLRTTWQRA